MNNPPPVLRTGLSNDVPSAKIEKNSPIGRKLISTVFVLVNRAATTAALICTHAKRTVVTEDDVKKALQYHAMTFLSEAEFESLEKDVESMQPLVDRFVTDDMTSEDVTNEICDDAEFTESEEEEEEEESPDIECECSVCTGIRDMVWDDWNPTDQAEIFIKRHVDEMLTR